MAIKISLSRWLAVFYQRGAGLVGKPGMAGKGLLFVWIVFPGARTRTLALAAFKTIVRPIRPVPGRFRLSAAVGLVFFHDGLLGRVTAGWSKNGQRWQSFMP